MFPIVSSELLPDTYDKEASSQNVKILTIVDDRCQNILDCLEDIEEARDPDIAFGETLNDLARDESIEPFGKTEVFIRLLIRAQKTARTSGSVFKAFHDILGAIFGTLHGIIARWRIDLVLFLDATYLLDGSRLLVGAKHQTVVGIDVRVDPAYPDQVELQTSLQAIAGAGIPVTINDIDFSELPDFVQDFSVV